MFATFSKRPTLQRSRSKMESDAVLSGMRASLENVATKFDVEDIRKDIRKISKDIDSIKSGLNKFGSTEASASEKYTTQPDSFLPTVIRDSSKSRESSRDISDDWKDEVTLLIQSLELSMSAQIQMCFDKLEGMDSRICRLEDARNDARTLSEVLVLPPIPKEMNDEIVENVDEVTAL